MGWGLSPVMRSGHAPVAAVASPGDADVLDPRRLGRALRRGDGRLRPARRRARRRPGGCRPRERPRGSRRTWPTGLRPTPRRTGSTRSPRSVTYPAESDFGTRLRYLAAMIEKPLGIRVAQVEADGDFDTHDDQADLGGLLADVSECLAPSRRTSRRAASRTEH